MSGNVERWLAPELFVIRTPYLPVDELLRLGDGLEGRRGDADMEAALERDRQRTRQRLLDLTARPDVREAIYLASPSLLQSADKWRVDLESRASRRVERSLLSYVSRMAARATPFGLFAGWSIGEVGPSTDIRLAEQSGCRRLTSVDGGVVGALVSELNADPKVRQNLCYTTNSTLYYIGDSVRYIEATRSGLAVVDVEAAPVLRAVLERAVSSATRRNLVDAVRGIGADVTEEESGAYVDDVIAAQLVVSDLEPTLTGRDGFDQLIDRLAAMGMTDVVSVLNAVRQELRAVDAEPPGVDVDRYSEIACRLKGLSANVDSSKVVKCELSKPASATIASDVAAEIGRGVELVARIGGCGGDDALNAFRTRFLNRYGDGEVALCEALDADRGMGFPDAGESFEAPGLAAPLINGLRFSSQRTNAETMRPREELLSRWLLEATHGGATEIVLGDAEVEELERVQTATELPDTFGVLATILAPGGEAVGMGDYRVHIAGASGPSGARLIGRFCTGEDELTSRVRAYMRAEEALRPDAVLAEIVHLPHNRAANVMARPVLRRWEIPYLGRSGAEPENQISVTDLLVSVCDGAVVLRSRRLGREVIPRLTAAHNFSARHSVPLYRFLCALQGQGSTAWLSFSFGCLAKAPFLPRVSHGRLILSRARWNLGADDLAPIRDGGSARRFEAMQALRHERRIPRWVAIADRDRLLPVDLDNIAFVDIVAEKSRRGRSLSLVEQFLAPDELLVSSPDGRFIHEVVMPFVRSAPRPRRPRSPALRREAGGARRRLICGSEWLYAKIYTGATGVDYVLRAVVRPTVAESTRSDAAACWFFVRYADPDWHLRLRIHGDPARLLDDVLPDLMGRCQPLIDDGIVWRTELDTYKPEVQRYGGVDGLRLAEHVFHHDSEAALRTIEHIVSEDDAAERWCFALAGCDRLMGDFGLDPTGRLEIVERSRQVFLTKLGADAALRREIGKRYRQRRRQVERVLSGSESLRTEPFAARSAALAPVRDVLGSALAPSKAHGWMSSLIHMHLNRILGWAIPQQELLIYDFLVRYYRSGIARSAQKRANGPM